MVVSHANGTTGRLYVNGELRATKRRDDNPARAIQSDAEIISAEVISPSTPYFTDVLTKVKIYNYARTTEEVAWDYLAVRGEWILQSGAGRTEL
jgi:hypothetical protein